MSCAFFNCNGTEGCGNHLHPRSLLHGIDRRCQGLVTAVRKPQTSSDGLLLFNPVPRTQKCVCVPKGFPVKPQGAVGRNRSGNGQGMASCRLTNTGLPVFVWAGDEHKQVYEAKPGEARRVHHGDRLYADDRHCRPLPCEARNRKETSDG